MGVQLEEDHVREPLYLKDSIQYHRELEKPQSITDGVEAIKAKQVWEDYGVRGEGVKICVLDTGVFAAHPDFAATNLTGYNGTEGIAMTPWNEDVRGHGTHVTGIIAASGNDEGVVGVAPGAEIYVMRVFRDNGNFYGSDIVAAAEACRDAGANIISMSLGGDSFDQAEHDIFEELYREGILAVASAGNTGSSDTIYPAAYNKVFSVTASDQRGKIAEFSTVNSHVNIAAPGEFHILRPASNLGSSFVLTRCYLFYQE
jgi:subtilisin family serine protease